VHPIPTAEKRQFFLQFYSPSFIATDKTLKIIEDEERKQKEARERVERVQQEIDAMIANAYGGMLPEDFTCPSGKKRAREDDDSDSEAESTTGSPAKRQCHALPNQSLPPKQFQPDPYSASQPLPDASSSSHSRGLAQSASTNAVPASQMLTEHDILVHRAEAFGRARRGERLERPKLQSRRIERTQSFYIKP
jgi:hypothetical protein